MDKKLTENQCDQALIRAGVRRQAQELRDHIQDKERKEKAIVEKLLPFLEGISCLGIYMPIRSEADIVRFLPGDVALAAPVVLNAQEMKFAAAANLHPGTFGVREPDRDAPEKQVSCILVPMLAFDNMRRLGYGKGYYDRWIHAHPDVMTIGIAFEEQHLPFPSGKWDEPLEWIITDRRVYHAPENETGNKQGK